MKANRPLFILKPRGTRGRERGSKEYNLALGQRRAANARKYLTGLGVAESRLSLISYGKEKPVCTQDTEEYMQKQKR